MACCTGTNAPVVSGSASTVRFMALIEVKERHITATRVCRMTDQQADFLRSVVNRPGGHRLDVTDNTTGQAIILRTENIEWAKPR